MLIADPKRDMTSAEMEVIAPEPCFSNCQDNWFSCLSTTMHSPTD